MSRLEISTNMNISILGFYGYIINFGEIFVDILIKISVRRKLFKIFEKTPKNDKISKNTYIKVIL